jgi:hypothetical protein
MGRGSLVLLLAALCVAACDSNTPFSTTTTSTATTTETFADTLSINGGKTFQFSSTARGTVTATLTSVAPESAVIGVSVGTWNGVICQIVLAKDQTARGDSFTGTVSSVGNLCLRVYDPAGTLTGPVTYSVDVAHP